MSTFPSADASPDDPSGPDAGSDDSGDLDGSANPNGRSDLSNEDLSNEAVSFDPAMDPAVTTIQPGGGTVMSIELAWGRVRRWYLTRFRKSYVQRMLATRQGQRGSLPFEPIDPRDVKYFRNQDTCWWAEEDDPFSWRDALPFVRAGLAELVLIAGLFIVLAAFGGWLWWPLSLPPLVIALLVVWFFRNPRRAIPQQAGTVVSPADGKLVQIEEVDDPDLGRCLQFGIFLSIFNVHVNRASLPGKVVAIRYRPGKFLNALRPESARENENLDVILRETEGISVGGLAAEETARLYRVRQITGQFARRIVCWVRPGDVLSRGEIFGMIKLGSRTELLVPLDRNLEITAEVGQKVKAGSTTLARYRYLLEVDEGEPRPETTA